MLHLGPSSQIWFGKKGEGLREGGCGSQSCLKNLWHMCQILGLQGLQVLERYMITLRLMSMTL